MGLGVAILLSACGVFFTRDTDSATRKIADEYGGIYVFDKKFRDEIIQREKERKEYRKNRYKQMDEEERRIVKATFTEEEIQKYKDLEDRIEKGEFISDNDPILIKVNKIIRDLNRNKYPNLIDEKFPRVLSNGCKYFAKGMSKKNLKKLI